MALPFPVPEVSAGFAALSPAAAAMGVAVGSAVAEALSRQLGVDVRVEGRALPAPAVAGAGVARATVVLEAAGVAAPLEVDAGLVARALERLSGSSPRTPAAVRATPIEQAFLDLLVLVAIDAARRTGAAALEPRLALEAREAERGGLAIALRIAVDDDHGSARLVVPARALRLIEGAGPLPPALAGLPLAASYRRGTSTLTAAEAAALSPGDVLLLDPGDVAGRAVLPGGVALHGSERGELFHVEEITMPEPQSTFPVTVAVELGRVTLTLGELARLAPGAALPLALRPDGAVVLRVGEVALAHGELVEIDGALGVRIAELGSRP